MRPVLLTVDDNPQVVRVIERDLKQQYGKRYSVLKAESGQEALKLVKKLKLQNEILALLLADQRMPDMMFFIVIFVIILCNIKILKGSNFCHN